MSDEKKTDHGGGYWRSLFRKAVPPPAPLFSSLDVNAIEALHERTCALETAVAKLIKERDEDRRELAEFRRVIAIVQATGMMAPIDRRTI